jgi:hypothetical protein
MEFLLFSRNEMKIAIKRELNCLDISKLGTYRALVESLEFNDFIVNLFCQYTIGQPIFAINCNFCSAA